MQSIKSARFTCLFIVLIALHAMPVISQTYIYNTVADGNWSSNAMWQNGASGKPPVSGNCDCVININPGHRLTMNQNVNISNAKIILHGNGSELRFSSEILLAPTMQLTGTSSIELRQTGASIESRSNFFGYNGNTISINGTVVFQGYSTQVNSSTRGVVNGPASASSSMSPPAFVNALLPVRLLEFGAVVYVGKVMLQWKTGEQENFDHFEIERSVNGTQWFKIGTVHGMREGYNAPVYSFTDLSPATGANYYRLNMIDIDLQYRYSRIEAVNISMQNVQVKVYPNPVTSVLYISNIQPDARHYVKLINRWGQVVLSRKFFSSESRISLNVHSLQRGIYFLKISDATGSLHTQNPIIIN
jgi:hypothetical protein